MIPGQDPETPMRQTPRPICGRCLRPETVCYCAELTTIETRTRIVILQHPRERGMPIGTARMAHLCLPNSSLHVGIAWDGTDVLTDACRDPRQPPESREARQAGAMIRVLVDEMTFFAGPQCERSVNLRAEVLRIVRRVRVVTPGTGHHPGVDSEVRRGKRVTL